MHLPAFVCLSLSLLPAEGNFDLQTLICVLVVKPG